MAPFSRVSPLVDSRTRRSRTCVTESGQPLSPKTFFLWPLILAVTVSCHKVIESTEDIGPDFFKNSTLLYPVVNITNSSEVKSESWKIETTFSKSDLNNDNNGTSSKEEPTDKSNSSQEFKPSPQVENYLENLEVVPTRPTFGDFANAFRKPSGFFGSNNDLKSSINKIPKDVFKNYNHFPYKIESPILTRVKDDWKPYTGSGVQDSKPTAEVPVRVPAGILYKAQDPFKDKPDEDFGLQLSEEFKDTAVKKRNNPWKKLLYLITSLIPVGLIFSALTPNVITIQPTGSEGQYPATSNIFRRADGIFTTTPPNSPPGTITPPKPLTPPSLTLPPTKQLPAISERCRRRLLCELQNEAIYAGRSSRHQRQCHRIPCEDKMALASTLNYLLNYQQTASAAFQHQLHTSGDTLDLTDHFT